MTDNKTTAAPHAAPPAAPAPGTAAATAAAAKTEAEKTKAEKEKAKAEYDALPEPERLRVDLQRLETEPEDQMNPDAHMKRRVEIHARLRELGEPIIAPPKPAAAPAPVATAKA